MTQADGDQTVTVKSGDTLALSLPENPTTGYRWQLDSPVEGHASLALLEDSFTPGGEQAGAAGTRSFVFAAQAGGSAEVRLRLLRPWGDPAPIKSLDIAVKVAAAK